jgi:uncharacterized membrane protein (DUF4010 family)
MNHLWSTAKLAELYALIAAVLPGSSALSMFRFDFLTVGAVIVVVKHVSVFGYVLNRLRVVRRDLCH